MDCLQDLFSTLGEGEIRKRLPRYLFRNITGSLVL